MMMTLIFMHDDEEEDDNDDNDDNGDVIDVRNFYYLIDIGGDGSLKNIMTQPSSKFFKRIEKVK